MMLASIAAFCAVWLWFPQRSRADRLSVSPPAPLTARRSKLRPIGGVMLIVLVVASIVSGVRAAVLVAMLCLVAATAGYLWWRYRARRNAQLRAAEVAGGCATLAAEVRAGRAAAAALEVVAGDHPPFVPVAAALQVGSSVAESMRHHAQLPGHEGLLQLARAWEVAQRTGAPLGPTLDAVAAGLRADQTVARATTTELAASRATGQLLGVLPVIGIGLGFVLGGNPIDFLFHSRFGLAFLAGGVVLTCAGLLWSDRLGDPR